MNADPTVIPAWMQWGSFGLLCAILAALMWFVRWLAQEFFGNLLTTVRELASDAKGHASKLDAVKDEVGELRDENTAWHERIERTIKEGRRPDVSTSTMPAVRAAPRPRQRSDPRREPDE